MQAVQPLEARRVMLDAAHGKVWCLGEGKADRYPMNMSKEKKPQPCTCSLRPHELTLWVVRPIARRLMLHHRIGLEQGKQLDAQLQELRRTVERMAEEVGRLSGRGE